MKFTLMICVGEWVKPKIRWDKHTKGICLGLFSINFHPFDMEEFIVTLIKRVRFSSDKGLEATDET